MRRAKRFLARFESWPIHPQWFAVKDHQELLRFVSKHAKGRIIDVGCGERHAERVIAEGSQYIGMDFPATALNWYGTRPHVFADAAALPIASQCADAVLLLDVLEHLPCPACALAEMERVLKPGGWALVQTPFMYPIHDSPLDFRRWTGFGLERMAGEAGLMVVETTSSGAPVETAALLFNLALTKTVLNCAERRNPLVVLAIVLPLLVLLVNLMAWMFARLTPRDDMMPIRYRTLLRKSG